MYATSQYSGESYNSRIGDGHSGQYYQQFNPHSRPFNVGTQVRSGHTHQTLSRFQASILQERQPSLLL